MNYLYTLTECLSVYFCCIHLSLMFNSYTSPMNTVALHSNLHNYVHVHFLKPHLFSVNTSYIHVTINWLLCYVAILSSCYLNQIFPRQYISLSKHYYRRFSLHLCCTCRWRLSCDVKFMSIYIFPRSSVSRVFDL